MILKQYQQISELENEVSATLKQYLSNSLNLINVSYDNGMGSVSFKYAGVKEVYLFELISSLAKINGTFENSKDVELYYQTSLDKLEDDLSTFLEMEDKLWIENRKQELILSQKIALILFPIIQDYLVIHNKNLENMAWPINKQQLLKFSDFLSQKI